MKGEGNSGQGLERLVKRRFCGPPVQTIINLGLKINTQAKRCINGPGKPNACEVPASCSSGRQAALRRPLLSGMSGPQCALCRGWLAALLLWALLLLPALPAARLARGAQPMLCAPCTPERLVLCPPVPPDCPEAARQPGCGCCQICALGPGQPCGVYTARCRLGLRCHIPAGESRPLSALIQGHGTCLPAGEVGEMRTEEPAGTAPSRPRSARLTGPVGSCAPGAAALPSPRAAGGIGRLDAGYGSQKLGTMSEVRQASEI